MRVVVLALILALLAVPALAQHDAGVVPPGAKVLYAYRLAWVDGVDKDSEAAHAAIGQHIGFVQGLFANGQLYMGGPFEDMNGALMVLSVASQEQAESVANSDPAVQAGIVRVTEVKPWVVMVSRGESIMAGGVPGAPSGSSAEAGAEYPEPVSGAFDFVEFPSTSIAESQAFYGTVFGWQFMPMPGDEDMAQMVMFSTPGGRMGSFIANPEHPPVDGGAIIYVNVDSVAATLAAVTAAGGTVELDSMALPENWGYIGQFKDPHGTRVGLWSMAQ